MKICRLCKTPYPLGAFGPNASRPDGLQSECRNCRREAQRDAYAKRVGSRKMASEVKGYLDGVMLLRSCDSCGEGRLPCLDLYVSSTPLRPFKAKALSAAKVVSAKLICLCKNCRALQGVRAYAR